MSEIEKNDVQALVLSGFPKHPFAAYLLLQVADRDKARRWLRQLVPSIAAAGNRRGERIVNVAFTSAGLRALGLDDDALATFSAEFQEGMAGNDHRARILGDTDASAPAGWTWGGPSTPAVHVLLLLYATSAQELEQLLQSQRGDYGPRGALVEVYARDTITLPERKEHFGFADGIAQPRLAGSGAAPKDGAALVKAGEFLVGYPNEYDKVPPGPTIAAALDPERVLLPAQDAGRCDFGRNGTYLVVRQLAQDVEGFWRAMYERSAGPDGRPDRDDAVRLAAKCVGRWPSGAPLVRSPDHDDPRFARDNGFNYAGQDPAGFACPLGSHIRRANPRDSLEPAPDESLTVVNRHRILRRGRSYGPPLAPFEKDASAAERGLFFICANTNIRRQFEFVQQTWLNNGKFNGLYEDKDPLLGDQDPAAGGIFTIPGQPVRQRLIRLPRFVTVRGGAYFFLPGLRALRALSASA